MESLKITIDTSNIENQIEHQLQMIKTHLINECPNIHDWLLVLAKFDLNKFIRVDLIKNNNPNISADFIAYAVIDLISLGNKLKEVIAADTEI